MMCIELTNRVIEEAVISGPAKSVLIYLAFRANANRETWVSVSNISSSLGLSRSTVFRSIDKLENEGFLIKTSRQKVSTTVYVVTIPEGCQSETGVRVRRSQSDTGGCQSETRLVSERHLSGVRVTPNRQLKKDKDYLKTLSLSKEQESTNELCEKFWECYPRKEGKKPAVKKLDLILKKSKDRESLYREIIAGLERWKRSRQWQDSKYIPHATTFLNQERWTETPVTGSTNNPDNAKGEIF